MLAGCSSTLLSPRHRLRSEASTQFQACHYPMSTQRLDLPCTFPRKDVSRPQSVRPVVGLSVEKPMEAKSLKQSIRSPEGRREIKADFWGDKGKNLKKRRLVDQSGSFDEDYKSDESCFVRPKRKKCSNFDYNYGESDDFSYMGTAGNFWVHPGFEVVNGEEEERVCFAPTDVIPPPMMPPPWVVESGVAAAASGGDREGDTSHHRLGTSGSSSSSESHSFGVRLNERNGSGSGSGSMLPNPGHELGLAPRNGGNDDQAEQQKGLELISFLMGCVEAISSRNIGAISHFIGKLGDEASPRGGSSITRLTAYFTEALALRVTRFWPHIFHISIPREIDRFDDEFGGAAFRVLNQMSPIPKFIHFTANEMLLRAFEGKDKVHIIDLDIKQGLQWPGFFQSLASRENPPSHVRMTGIGESKQELIDTGERLAGFAEALNLNFEFHPVVDRLEDVRLWMLHVKEGESVAVNSILQLHRTLYDGTAFRELMGLIRSTNPIGLVMAEQEGDHNEPSLEARVCNSLRYYAAIFDGIDSSLPIESPARVKIEEMYGREIRNMIACEGGDRMERHEKFRNWRRKMEVQGGFRCVRSRDRGPGEMKNLTQMLLNMYSNHSYTVEIQGEDEGVTLGWMDQPLYTVSFWAPTLFPS